LAVCDRSFDVDNSSPSDSNARRTSVGKLLNIADEIEKDIEEDLNISQEFGGVNFENENENKEENAKENEENIMDELDDLLREAQEELSTITQE